MALRSQDWVGWVAIPVAVIAIVFPLWLRDHEQERDVVEGCRTRNTQLRVVLLRDDALLRGVNQYAGDSAGSRQLEAAIRAEWDTLELTYRDCNNNDIVGDDGDFAD